LPVVAETADDELNDMNGFHVKPEDVFHALDSAHGGPVEGAMSAVAREWSVTNSKVEPALPRASSTRNSGDTLSAC
jgi:hypothetical protein